VASEITETSYASTTNAANRLTDRTPRTSTEPPAIVAREALTLLVAVTTSQLLSRDSAHRGNEASKSSIPSFVRLNSIFAARNAAS
jgi:hypothetical protein